MAVAPGRREMLQAVRSRDAAYDGVFVVAVRTTGVFCRPSCPSRAARTENLEFFRTPASAERAGYRPCRRCRPRETDGRAPAWLSNLLDRLRCEPGARWTDADLRAAGIEPSRARRHFRQRYGMTWQQYARRWRLLEAQTMLKQGRRTLEAGRAGGYRSDSGFRDSFSVAFGRTPRDAREVDPVVTTLIESPIGPLLVGATDHGVAMLHFDEGRSRSAELSDLSKRLGAPLMPGEHALLDDTRRQLGEYFAGKRRDFDLPLDPRGTAFQRRVWRALQAIPYGRTCSYADIAAAIRSPGAVRAVGQANHHNPIAIIIPCHRVVNADGRLGGYGGGLWRKQYLLDLERGASRLPL